MILALWTTRKFETFWHGKVGHDGKNFQLVPSDPLTKCKHGRSFVVLFSDHHKKHCDPLTKIQPF